MSSEDVIQRQEKCLEELLREALKEITRAWDIPGITKRQCIMFFSVHNKVSKS